MHFQPSAYSQSGYGDASTARLPTLRIGATDAATGNAVSRVINALVRNGYPVAGLTGPVTPGRASYGPKVVAAVKAMQQALDLGADGVVGPKTWEAILVLEATSGAKMIAGAAADEAATTVTPGASAGSSAPGETVTLPDGTVVSNVPTSAWAKFRAHKAFWPAVGGIALAGAIVTGLAIRAMRKSR
jgi:peptidoglycan hydrolase-like protein with peptidoglycan-binding domain